MKALVIVSISIGLIAAYFLFANSRHPALESRSVSRPVAGQDLSDAHSPVQTTDAKIIIIRYPRPESTDDMRHSYYLELCTAALEHTAESGRYRLEPAAEVMSELRLIQELEAQSPLIDIMVRPTSKDDEKHLTPIRIPLDKGLLGIRLLLINKNEAARFSAIRDVTALKAMQFGQGQDWNDVAIYKHNGFKVVTTTSYESLFLMLNSGRFDAFPRGVEEIFLELEKHRTQLPDLEIEKTLVIRYPFARYFWLSDSEKGQLLRKRITTGLELMIRDGSFERLFWKYMGESIRKSELPSRRVISLENPFLPDDTPTDRPELWYNP